MEPNITTPPLTSREKQILTLVAGECSTLEISSKLRISVRTVETHRKNILRKTNSRSIVGLTKFAIKSGLLEGYYYKAILTVKNPASADRTDPDTTDAPLRGIRSR